MEIISNINDGLLEGCIWDEYNEQLYFADILCRKIHILCSSDNRPEEIEKKSELKKRKGMMTEYGRE